jgi:hypothetical protein
VSAASFLSDEALRELEPLLELARSVLAAPSGPTTAASLRAALAAAPIGALSRAAEHRLAQVRPTPGRSWIGHDLLEVPAGRVSLFLLPAGAVIPLHDHPDMIVLMRVVLGRVRVISLDWVDRRALLARPSGARVLGAGDDVVDADPTDRNLHAVEALEPSAFLDVLTPDYAHDRPCTYFVAQPTNSCMSPRGLMQLRPIPSP